MEPRELLDALEANPADTSSLDAALQDSLAAGGPETLDVYLAEFGESLSKGPAAEAVLKALDAMFRKQKDTEIGPVLAWHAGRIAWKVLEDLVRAEFFLKALVDGKGHEEEWNEFYRAFYASRGNWLRLEQFLAEVAARTSMSPIEMKRALAKTAQQFNNQAKELSYWQAVVQAAPGDAEASVELERLYSALERWPSLADLLKERLKAFTDDQVAEKVEILDRMIAIFRDKMHAEPKVLQTYQMILDIDPANTAAIDALLHQYESAGRWPDYAKVLQRKIDNATEIGEQIALREVQAQLMETRFANAVEALKAYEKILELAPERQDVIEKLKDLYDKRRDFENLIRLRKMEAEREMDGRKRAAIYVELAIMATERLRKFPVAIELWEQVLEIDETHAEALKNLEGLYEREKDIEKLCGVLKRRIDLCTNDNDRVQLLEKLAGLYGTKLNDSLAALETWKAILAVQPTHDRAKRELRARFLAEHRWDDLEWFLRKFGTVDELARTLESQLGSVTDAAEKQGLLYKLASVWRDELAQPPRAVKNLEAVLQIVVDDLRAALELIALYRQLNDFRKLPAVYDIAIAKTEDRATRMHLMIEAAEVHEKHLNNLERAFFWFIEAYKEDMLDDSLRGELERLAGPSQNWDTYVAVLEQAAGLMPDATRQISTWLRVGEIFYKELANPVDALDAFKTVLSLDDVNAEAIGALEAIYRQLSRFDDLVGILNLRLVLESDGDKAREVRYDLADILYSRLRKVDDAVRVYNEILQDQPYDGHAYDELSDLLLKEERFDDLLALLTNEVEVFVTRPGVPASVLADLHCRIALLSCGLHGPSAQVIGSYARALEYAPLHAQTLELLENLLPVDDVRLEVVGLLKGPFEALKRWADLADLYEIELRERGDGTDTLDLLWHLHDQYSDHVADDRKLFRTLGRILDVTPDDTRAWDLAERAAAPLVAWRELASKFEKAAEASADPTVKVALWLRLARIYLDELHIGEQAKRAYQDILGLDESNKDALDALEAIYDGEQAHPKRLEIYRRQYDVSPYQGEKISYAFKMAGVLADNLGDLEGGIEAVKLILGMDGEYEPAYRQLDSLYARAGKWDQMPGVLDERIRLAGMERDQVLADGDADRAAEFGRDITELRLRLAEIKEERLGDLAGAVEVYRTVTETDPANEEALRQLERLFEENDVRTMVAPILLKPYTDRKDWSHLVEVYDVMAESAGDLDEKLGHLDTIAMIYEMDVADLDAAFVYRARAFRTAPERESLVSEVLRIGRERNALDEAVFVLCEKVFDIEDEERRKETNRTIAATCRDGGIDRELAKRHYSEVLIMDPADMDALDSLIGLHRDDDEVEPLVGLVLRKADLVMQGSERAQLLLYAGDLYASRLKKDAEAIQAFVGVLDIEPTNWKAIEALETLYGAAEKWDELVDVLGRKAGCAPDTEGRVAALKKKGLVQHEKMGNTADAIETFLEVHGIVPADVDALRVLDRLYGAVEDWFNLYSMLEKLLALLSGEDKLTVHYRMGRLLEVELSDPTRAVQTYSDILDYAPEDNATIDALEGMVRKDEAAEDAFRVLSPALSGREEWERLFVVYEVVTERADDINHKVVNYLTMGEIAESRMKEPLRAFDCYGRAFTTDPQNGEALEYLEALASTHDMWENVPALMLEAAGNIEGTPEALSLRLRAGAALRDRLGDGEGAAKAFESIIADYPDNREALTALDALYTQMEKWEDLARILKARIDATSDVDEKVGYYLRFAEVSEQKLDKTGAAALEARREVLYLIPAHDEAVNQLRRMFDEGKHQAEILEVLEPIYKDQAQWMDLATVYEEVLPAIEDANERKNVLMKLGGTWLDKLDRKDSAIAWFGQALALDPTDETLLVQIEQLAAESDGFAALLDIQLAAATAAEDDERRVYLWHKAAKVAREKLGDQQRAEAINRWILDVLPQDREALSELDSMYESQDRWADLHGILERECEAAEYDDEKVKFFLRSGAVQRDRLGDGDGAVFAFRQVLRIDDMHRDALNALADLHEIREEHEDLFKVLGTLADIAPTGADRAVIQRRMAKIAEDNLGQKDKALELWEEISRIVAEDVTALHELQRLYSGKEDWTAFVDASEREIPLVREDAERTTTLLRQIARAAEEFLADGYQAQMAWRRVLEVYPTDVEALQSLRRLYREGGDLESLSDVLTRLADSGQITGGELFELYQEHARLLTEELPKPELAIEKWNKVLDIDRENAGALATLDQLYEDVGRIGECVEIVKRRAALTADQAERAELLLRAGDLLADRQKDLRAAAATLEEIVVFNRGNVEVSERLHSLYTRLEEWDSLGEVLLRRDDFLTETDDRIQNLMELARVYEDRKDDRESAFLILDKAVHVNPADENVLAEAWRITQAVQNWTDYVEALSEVVEKMPDDQMQEHLLRFGEILWKNAEQPTAAIGWFEKTIEKWPENETALAALTDLYSDLKKWEPLVKTLTARIELTPDYLEKVQFQLRVGYVLDKEIWDSQRAQEAYRKVLEFDESNLDALDALSKIYEFRQDWENLIGVLRMKAPLVPADEVATRLRAATILEEKVADLERAIAAYEEVLSIEPTQADSLDRLQALYGQLGNWKGLADVFERLLDLSGSDPDRILFCNRLGVLWEEALGDKAKALEFYLRILDMDAEDDEVFETAARLYTELEQWNELVNLLEGRVTRADDKALRIATLERIADVYEYRMGDQNSAVYVWRRILDQDATFVKAYPELERLFKDMEAWEDMVQTLLQWKEHAVDDAEFVSLLLRAATIVKDRIENPDRAIKLLGDVLRMEPGNEAAAERLRLIYGELEEWEKVAEVYLTQESAAATDEAKARLRAAAADVYQHKLKDKNRAISHYEKALQLNPRLHDVALALARAYVGHEKWEKAEPLLDMLLSGSEATQDPARAGEIHFNLGLCAEKLFDFEKAFREYQAAIRTRGDHVGTMLGLGRLYQRKQLWQLAKDHFMKALDLAGEAIEGEERIEILFSLGEVSLELNELSDAVDFLDQVLAADPNHGKAVNIQIAIAEKRGDWSAVIRYKQTMLASRQDPFEKFAIQLEIGDIYSKKLGNMYGATSAYREALSMNPDAKVVQLRLLDLYLETGAFEDALYTLEVLAKAENNNEKKALHYVRMAALYQEKMNDLGRAIEHLNLALDADPDRLEAFRAIDELLTQTRQWEAQAENYRRMLERLKGRGALELEYRLYFNLGEIYRSRMKQVDYAIAAYSAAAKIKPEERKSHEILAQLYEYSGDQLDRAVEEHRAIIMASPLSQESAASYKAMRRIFLEMKELDKAFVATSVLVGLGIADPQEVQFFEGNLEPSLPWFKGTIDNLRWESHLMAKSENTLLGRILQTMYGGLGAELGAKDLKDIGLKKKNEFDLEMKLLFVNVYKAVAKALGPMPHRVYRDEAPCGMKVEFTSPPAFVVGSDMLTGHEERELAFLVGRQLAYVTPQHFLATVKNLTELKIFLAAVLKFCKPETQISTGLEVVTELVRLIERRMPQQQKNQLARFVDELSQRYGLADFGGLFEDYFREIECTAIRAGTLVCGNVDTALRVIQAEEVSFSGMPQRERLEEVIRFAVSDDHFLLRRALGIQVEGAV